MICYNSGREVGCFDREGAVILDNEGRLGAALSGDYMTYPRKFASYRWFWPVLVGILFLFFYVNFQGIILMGYAFIFGAESFDQVASGGYYESMNFFDNPQVIVSMVLVAAMLPCLALASCIVKDRPFSSYSSSRGNGWSWRLFSRCLVVSFLVLGLELLFSLILTFLSDAENVEVRFNLLGLLLIVGIVPFQCLAEEYVFRGFISQTLASWTRLPIVGVIVPSLMFAALHPYNLIGVVNIFLDGAVFSLLAWRTKGLEASSAFHIVSNVQAFLLTAVHFAGEKTSGISSEVSVFSACVGVATILVYMVCIFVIMRKKPDWFECVDGHKAERSVNFSN